MPNYILRVRAGRLREGVTDPIVGAIRAADQIDLFDKIDEFTNPFDYEYWELPKRLSSQMPSGKADVPWKPFTAEDQEAWAKGLVAE